MGYRDRELLSQISDIAYNDIAPVRQLSSVQRTDQSEVVSQDVRANRLRPDKNILVALVAILFASNVSKPLSDKFFTRF